MFKVGLIGLGNMATGGEVTDPYIYSHIGGIKNCTRVELSAVMDISIKQSQLFKEKWGESFPHTKIYSDIVEMLENEKLDVVDICVGGIHHYNVTMEVIRSKYPPKVIFLEKAPTASLDEMDQMLFEAKEKGIIITVSYSRHWYPHMLQLQETLKTGLIGDIKTVVGYCRGWILSMGSHQTDMICQFAGYSPIAVTAVGRIANDPEMDWFSIDDVPIGYEPEPLLDSMMIEYSNGVIGYHIGEYNDFWGLYCDIFGTKGRIRVQSDKIHISGCNSFDKIIDVAEFNIPERKSVFSVAFDQIADYLEGGPKPDCTDENWVAVHEIGFAGIESIHLKKRIELPNQTRDRKIFIL